MTFPLSGLRVIDAGMNVAGPMAAGILGDLGAEVVKVEPPTGDTTRKLLPAAGEASAIFAMANRNKRYVSLDLKTPDGRDQMAALIATADVVIENLRPGKSVGVGLDPASVHAIRPTVVHASISAFHDVDQARPGYDLLVQAESGIMDLTGEADGSPVRLPGTMVDQVTASWAALGVLAELHGPRDRATVDVRMMDVAMWLLAEKVSSYQATGTPPQRSGAGTSVTTPHGAYRASDGDLVIGAASDAMFARLVHALGTAELQDARFASQAGRLELRGELDAAIERALSGGTADEWVRRLDAAGIPVARIRALPESLEHHERHSATGVRAGDHPALAPPVQLSGRRWELGWATGAIGRDNDAVLAGLGDGAGVP